VEAQLLRTVSVTRPGTVRTLAQIQGDNVQHLTKDTVLGTSRWNGCLLVFAAPLLTVELKERDREA
jgi:hypothetical protein